MTYCSFQIVKSCVVVRQSQPCWWKQVFWDVTLFRRGVMPICSGSNLSSAILGLLYHEDGGTPLLRNAGNYSWQDQTSRQTSVFRMATVGTIYLGFPNEGRKKGLISCRVTFLGLRWCKTNLFGGQRWEGIGNIFMPYPKTDYLRVSDYVSRLFPLFLITTTVLYECLACLNCREIQCH